MTCASQTSWCPWRKTEALDIGDVKHAVVGDIVATLKADGRAHALVVGKSPDGKQVLLGIFSVSIVVPLGAT